MTCFLFFCVSFVMSCWTYGGMYPSGLFVPSIAAGAALGRYTAEVRCAFSDRSAMRSTPPSSRAPPVRAAMMWACQGFAC